MNPIAFEPETFDVAIAVVLSLMAAAVAVIVYAVTAQSLTKRKKRKRTRPSRSLPPAWWRHTAIDELLLLAGENAGGFKTWRDLAGPFAAIMSKAREQRSREFDELERSGGLDLVWLRDQLRELDEIYRDKSSGKIHVVDFAERTVATLSRSLAGVAACLGADLADVLGTPIFSAEPWTPTELPPASVVGRAAEAAARIFAGRAAEAAARGRSFSTSTESGPAPTAEELQRAGDRAALAAGAELAVTLARENKLPATVSVNPDKLSLDDLLAVQRDRVDRGRPFAAAFPIATVREIVGGYLRRYGFDGLVSASRFCSCSAETWPADSAESAPPFPCGACFEKCVAGFFGPAAAGEEAWQVYATRAARDAASVVAEPEKS